MSVAGAATLFVTNDYLHAVKEKDLSKPITNVPLDRAVAWMGKYFSVERNLGRDGPLNQAPDDDLVGALVDRPRGS